MVAFHEGRVIGPARTILTPKHPLHLRCGRRQLEWGDPLLLTEVLRQAVIASVHLLAAPAQGSAFIMERMVLSAVGVGPEIGSLGNIELVTREEKAESRTASSNRIITHVDFRRGAETFATGVGHLRIVSRASYVRLRGAGAFATSADLAASTMEPVGLTPCATPAQPLRWRVGFDPHDSFFFDHPTDHVPGMLIFEAVRMAAQNVLPDDLCFTGFDGTYCRYVELNEDLHVELNTHGGGASFEVTGANAVLAARGYLTFASPS
ncbi:AfsA-related hotdog domain-containing protein [Microbacterium sp. P04]